MAFEKIEIFEMRDNTFYAKIYARINGETSVFDARPSDAVALALHEKMAGELWARAVKGSQAVALMRDLLARTDEPQDDRPVETAVDDLLWRLGTVGEKR